MGSYRSKYVILDTNMILSIFEQSIDLKNSILNLIGKCEIVVPRTVLKELYLLSVHGKGKRKINAQSAIDYVERNFDIIENEGDTDTSLISLAKRLKAVVATNDRELRKKLRENSIPVLFLRERKKLVSDGTI
ncbi:MAG TPA: hypothetical protein ENF43_03075 [Thermoplasmatales archaeon]|nr:hypothetical protein [Thermoplasmatales archaeon]